MRWKPHVRFGERAGETDRPKDRHRAPVRLHLGLSTLNRVRQRVQQDTLGHRGRATDPLYRARRLAQVRADRLDQSWLAARLDAGDPHGEVTAAWVIAQAAVWLDM